MDRERLYGHLREYLRESGRNMHSFIFLNQYLSPVRNQGRGGQCAFVATVTCLEIIVRISKVPLSKWSGQYFFNIDDVFDNLYDVYPNLPGAKEKKNDVKGLKGTRVNFILEFVRKYGLLPTSCCYDPRKKNLISQFHEKASRCQISSYQKLRWYEVAECVKDAPVIFVMVAYKSFNDCRKVVYDGPSEDEKSIPEEDIGYHAAVIVGSVKIEAESQCEEYVIVQNSHGSEFGFLGLVVMKLDYPGVFKEFWKLNKPKWNDAVTHKRKHLDVVEQHDKGETSSCP